MRCDLVPLVLLVACFLVPIFPSVNAFSENCDVAGQDFEANNSLRCSDSCLVMGTPSRPQWFINPTDQVVEYRDIFSMELRVSDAEGIDHWWTSNSLFRISPLDGTTAVITNASLLYVGVYELAVRAYNPSNQYCSASFSVTIQDTIAPTFTIPPEDETLVYGQVLEQHLSAEDLSIGIYWSVSNSWRFSISSDGLLRSRNVLGVGQYQVSVTVTDNYDNSRVATCTIEVIDTGGAYTQPWLGIFLAATILGFLLLGLVIWQRSRGDRLRPGLLEPASVTGGRARRTAPQCRECGAAIRTKGAKECPSCGAKRWQCTVCHTFIETGEKYLRCPHCSNPAHRTHLLEWLKIKGVCPFCQQKLRRSELV